MPGNPKKRARKKARELAEAESRSHSPVDAAEPPARTEEPARADGATQSAPPAPALPAPLTGEVLPPEPAADDAEPTRTALRRAMRRKAQEYAERALEVLSAAMESKDERISVTAANAILDRAHGKPTPDIEVGEGGLQVVILKFGDGQ